MSPDQPDDQHAPARDQLAAALGARDEEEARAFTETAAELAMQLPPVAPSPDTKAALFARIGALPARDSEVDSAVDHLVPRRAGRPSRRWRRPGIALAATAAALVLFFAGFAARDLLSGAQPQRTASADPVATILAQPDASRASRPISTGGTATLVWSAAQGSAAIILKDAGPAPSGKTYELWFIRSGTPVAAGTLDASSTALSTKKLAGEVKAGDQIAITIEPARGTSQPTTTPIAVIPTSS